jgi:hypothetical protein
VPLVLSAQQAVQAHKAALVLPEQLVLSAQQAVQAHKEVQVLLAPLGQVQLVL